MKITMRHYYDFGADRSVVGDELVRASAWDALRTETTGAFALAASREELEHTAEARDEIAARAHAIDGCLARSSVRTLASYGVGGAVLEWWLLRLAPGRHFVLAEYAPKTLERLRELFPGVDVQRHDLLDDPPLPADVHLFHRIDTELTDAQWREVLERFADETVLVVATEVATLRRLVSELMLRIRRRQSTRAGWLRTRDAFESLWRETHDARPVRLHDLQGWVLTPRRQ
jgi:hypothetical protein